jgi:hypothetical protein
MPPGHPGRAGRIEEHLITSEMLKNNPLGDPHERRLFVYLPSSG